MEKKSLSESMAILEELIFEYDKLGNKRASNAAKLILKRLKKEKATKKGGLNTKKQSV